MTDRIQIAGPYVRRLLLEEGGTPCSLTSPAYVLGSSDDPQRAFSVGYDDGIPEPVRADQEWELPRRDAAFICDLTFYPGEDLASSGEQQVVALQIWRNPIDFGQLLSVDGNVPRFVVTFYDPDTNDIIGRYSDIGYVDPGNNAYPGLVQAIDASVWSINMNHLQPQNHTFELTLLNRNNEIADLAAATRSFFGVKVDIRLVYVQTTGVEAEQQIFEGIAEIRKSNSTAYMIDVLPVIGERMSGMQREINIDRFPNVRPEDVGQPMQIIAGIASRPQGAVYAPVIDTNPATGNTWICVSQDYIKSIDEVYRWRSGDISIVSFTPGVAQDELDEWYTYAQIAEAREDGDQFFVNVTGIETAGDGTGTAILNAADGGKEILKRYAGRIDGDFVPADWSAFAAYLTDNGFDGNTAIVLPIKKGERLNEGRDLLTALARSFDVAFYLDYNGKIGVAVDLDVSRVSEDPSALVELSATRDLSIDDISTNKSREQFYNAATVNIGTDHGAINGVISTYRAEDRSSIEYFKDKVEANLSLPFVNDLDLSKFTINRRVLRAAGEQRVVKFPLIDMRGIEIFPGQRIALTHPLPGDGSVNWDRHEVIVERVELDHFNLLTIIYGMEVGKTFGPLVFPGQQEVVIPIDEDLLIKSDDPDTNYDGALQVAIGDNIPTFDADIWRTVIRTSLIGPVPATPRIDPTAEIEAGVLEFYTEEGNNDGNEPITGRKNPAINAGLHELLENSWIMASSTFAHFTEGGSERAVQLNGIDDEASTADDAVLRFSTAAAFNFKTTGIDTAVIGEQALGNKIGVTSPNNDSGYDFGVDGAEIYLKGKNTGTWWIKTNTAPILNENQVIKIEYDGSIPQVDIYLDEVLIATATNSAQTGCVKTGTITSSIYDGADNVNFSFGARQAPGSTLTNFFKGTVAWLAMSSTITGDGTPLAKTDANGVYWDFEDDLDDSGPNGLDLASPTIDSGNYVDVPAGAPWTDDNYANTVLAAVNSAKSKGWHSFTLKAAGIAYLQTKVTVDSVDLTLNVGRVGDPQAADDLNEWLKIASRLSSNAWRLRLTIRVP